MCSSFERMSSKLSLLKCSQFEVNLNYVLACAQSFRWKQNSSSDWVGVLNNDLWILNQNKNGILYKKIEKDVNVNKLASETNKEKRGKLKSKNLKPLAVCTITAPLGTNPEDILKDYFQINVNISELYSTWCEKDEVFKKIKDTFHGIRILRQDPVENLFSFICSQNNNIVRITALVNKLCCEFGEKIIDYEGEEYFSFPKVETLAKAGTESRLRELGFGYRAKFIHQSAVTVVSNGGVDWLYSLRKLPYKEARQALCGLPGVGLKVADCVCLMSLDKTDAVPIDTHMWQIACRDYLPHLKKYKSITDKVYDEIGDHFRKLFGVYSGWAHSVLFSSNLKKFKSPEKPEKKESSPTKRSTTEDKETVTAAIKRKKKSAKA